MLARAFIGYPKDYQIKQFASANSQLDLRFIIGDDGDLNDAQPITWEAGYADTVIMLEAWGWKVRRTQNILRESFILVDRNEAIVPQIDDPQSSGVVQLKENDPATLSLLNAHFDTLWKAPQSEIFFEFSFYQRAESTARVLLASEERWSALLAHFASHPEELRTMPDRSFEELVAELLVRDGMEICLTQKTRDKGRDILATARTSVGTHLYLVECKRYSPHCPVGVGLVRALYGTVEHERATAGLIVTTSRFTKDAQNFAESIHHRLSLKDYDSLKRWIMNATEPSQH